MSRAHDELENDETVDYLQVHVRDPDAEYETLCACEVSNPEPEFSEQVNEGVEKRILAFTRGGGVANRDQPYEIHQGRGGQHRRTVVKGYPEALGYYIHGLEQHAFPKEKTFEELEKDLYLEPYYTWQEELSCRKRRLRLLDLMEWRSYEGDDFIAEKYLKLSTWRTTQLTDSGERLLDEIARNSDAHPRMCYYSAGEAAIKHRTNHRVDYVEGFVLPEQAGQAVRHAWLEIDGQVAEITWPWHYPDGGEAIYFGVPISIEEVKEKRRSGGSNGPIILNDEEIRQLTERL